MNQNTFIVLLVISLIVLLIISYAHKVYVKKKKGHKHPPHHPCPPCPDCPPRVTGLKIDTISANNNTIILKGKKMSVSLVGKQQVVINVVPTTDDGSGNQVPIDLSLWTLDQLFQPGSIQATLSDLTLASVSQDPTNPLAVTVAQVEGASGVVILTVIGINLQGTLVSVTDDITVSPAETTTSTSTTTTTTEAPPTAPLVSGLALQEGTPTDVV